jgi:hypothetical protein
MKWKAEVVELIESLIPNVPVYLEHADDHPHLRRDNGCLAYTGHHVDLLLLRKAGVSWNGRGFATIYCQEENGYDDETNLWAATFTMLHELSHFCQRGRVDQPEPEDMSASELERLTSTTPQESADVALARVFRRQLKDGIPPDECPGHPLWYLHPVEFWRMTHHVGHRAGVSPRRLADPANYGLSEFWKYESAIGDEPKRREHLDLRDVAEMPIPEDFTALFQKDTNDG